MNFLVEFLRGMLGGLGSRALDFYIQYSFPINGLVLVYAILVIGARRSYAASRAALLKALIPRYAAYIKEKKREQLRRALGRIDIPWQTALEATRFPLITAPGGLWVYPRTMKTLQRLFNPDRLTDELLKG